VIEIVARFPGEVTAGLDAHLDVSQHEADVLVLYDRYGAEPLFGPGEIKGVVKSRPHGAHACRPDQCRCPTECFGEDPLSL